MRKFIVIVLSILFVAWLCAMASNADARSSSASRSSSSYSRSSSSSISSTNRFSNSSTNSYKSPALIKPSGSTAKPSSFNYKAPKPAVTNLSKPSKAYTPKPFVTSLQKNKPVVYVNKTTVVKQPTKAVYTQPTYRDNSHDVLTGALVATAIVAASNVNANQQSAPQPPAQVWPKFNFLRDCNQWKCN